MAESVRRVERWTLIGALAVLVCLVVGVYANTFTAGFHLDDRTRILNNPFVRLTSLSIEDLRRAAFKPPSMPNRPVGNLTFALNYYFHRYRPAGYHAVNIAVHALAAVFLCLFVLETVSLAGVALNRRRLLGVAVGTAVLWALHPLHTQTVTYIVQRQNGLAGMFYICAMWAYVKGRRSRTEDRGSRRACAAWYLAATAAGMLALGSKPNAVTLPGFILLYDWFFFGRLKRRWWREHLGLIIAMASITILAASLYAGGQPVQRMASFRDFAADEFTVGHRLLTQPRVIWRYLSLLAWPLPERLNLDYDYVLSSSLWSPATTLPALLGLLAMIAAVIALAPRHRLAAFIPAWFLGNLALESFVLPLAVIFEHRTYLPSMLLPLALLLPLARIHRPPRAAAGMVAGMVAVTAVLLAWGTVTRNRVWSDELTLWQDVARKSPRKPRVLVNLASALKSANRIEEALQTFQHALQISPSQPNALIGIAFIKLRRGEAHAARDILQGVVDEHPQEAQAHQLLGESYLQLGDLERARDHTVETIRLNPHLINAHLQLAEILERTGRLQDAMVHLDIALRLDPESIRAQVKRARVLAAAGKPAEAFDLLDEVLQKHPDDIDAHRQYSLLLNKAGRGPEALARMRRILALEPGDPTIHYNLATLLTGAGETDQALEHYRRALELDPDYSEARNNLANLLVDLGRAGDALPHFRKLLDTSPDNAEFRNNLGAALLKQGHIDTAVTHLKRAAELDPADPGTRSNLEQALARQDRLDRLRQELAHRVAAAPGSARRRLDLAQHYHARGMLNDAVREYRATLTIEPRANEALNGLAGAYAEQGRHAEAAGVLLRMRSLWPENSVIDYNLACMYARGGNTAEGLAALESALQKGYANWDLLATDPDLEALRGTAAFEDLLQRFTPAEE